MVRRMIRLKEESLEDSSVCVESAFVHTVFRLHVSRFWLGAPRYSAPDRTLVEENNILNEPSIHA